MSYDERALSGVKGWLAFFVVTLMLSAVVSLAGPLITKASTSPVLTMRPGWSAYLGVLWVITLGRTAGLAYLAWLLNARQVSSTPRTVIGGLWLIATLPILLDLTALVLLLDLSVGQVAPAVGSELIRPVGYAAVWTAYLLRSRRVANTYAASEEEELAAVFE